ncbi:MAG: uracil-DNA glycosylase [Gemmataceae bacterium]
MAQANLFAERPVVATWDELFDQEKQLAYYQSLQAFVSAERAAELILPAEEDVFAAFHATPLEQVRVVLLGQDPYPTPGHAHGLCFSVRPGVALPASLRNIYQELQDDLGIPLPKQGTLTPWARQGVLLMNTVLTVRAGQPNSHAKKGWEKFTDAVIDVVLARPRKVVFVLWGAHAQKKLAGKNVEGTGHVVIASVHPSPLSARSGFFGSRPFSRINAALESWGDAPINWALPVPAK